MATYICWLEETSEASWNDADISISLPIDITPEFSYDAALVSIPH